MTQVSSLTTRRTLSWARPPRVAVFFDAAKPYWDESWVAQFRRLIGSATEVWGGFAFIFVPHAGGVPNSIWQQIIRAYDPDLICYYTHSEADAREAMGERWELKWRERLAKSKNQFDEAAIRDFLTRRANELFRFSWSGDDAPFQFFTSEAITAIRDCCSPFVFDVESAKEFDFSESITLGNPSFYRTMAIKKVLTEGHTYGVRQLDLSGFSDHLSLYMESRVGRFNMTRLETLRKSNTLGEPAITIEVERPDSIFSLYQLVGKEDQRLLARESNEWPWPSKLSGYGLEELIVPRGANRFLQTEDLPLTVVLGNTIDDFALFYALSRIRPGAFWLPDNEAVDLHQLVDLISGSPRRPSRNSTADCCTSISLSQAEAQELFDKIRSGGNWRRFGNSSAASQVRWTPPEDVARSYAERAYRVRGTIIEHVGPYVGGISSTSVPTPLPEMFRGKLATEVTWLGEFWTAGFQPPSRKPIAQLLARKSNDTYGHLQAPSDPSYLRMSKFAEVRAFPGSMMVMGVPIEQFLLPVQLVRPDDMELFQAICSEAGFALELSDKGRYAEVATNLLGGLNTTVEHFLGSASYRYLFDAFCAPRKSKDALPGRWIASDARRVLSATCVATQLQRCGILGATPVEGLKLLETLAQRSATTRGLCVTCSRCSRNTWYALADLSQVFKCRFCLVDQPLELDSVSATTTDGKLVPFYRLDEMVAQTWQHNSDLPIRACFRLLSLGRSMMAGTHCSHEVYLTHNDIDEPIELDLLASLGGRLVIGECKRKRGVKQNRFLERQQLNRLRDVCIKLHADIALFVTDASAWPDNERIRIETAFRVTRTRCCFWSAADLDNDKAELPLI